MYERTNLLEETIEILKVNNKTLDDIVWIGSKDGDHSMSKTKFLRIAKATNYNAGYGSQEIACDLVVVGNKFWLERHENDGEEWWEFKSIPKKKNDAKNFDDIGGRLSVDGKAISQLNKTKK